MIVEVNGSNWDREVMSSDKPVVVDFWAPGCSNCERLAPIMERLAWKFTGRAKVCTVNTHQNPDLTVKFQIGNLPHVMIFNGGKNPKHELRGLISETDVAKLLHYELGDQAGWTG